MFLSRASGLLYPKGNLRRGFSQHKRRDCLYIEDRIADGEEIDLLEVVNLTLMEITI